MTTHSSDETAVVATYSARHDAEIARSFLADHGINAFVVADDVHVSLQLSEGARLLVMQRQAEDAYQALANANLLPGSLASDGFDREEEAYARAEYEGDGSPSDFPPVGYPADGRGSSMHVSRSTIRACTAAALVIVLLFFVPWRVERTDAIMWAPFYRPPISHATTFQELETTSVRYETGDVAFDILILQALGVVAAGWLASIAAGAMAGGRGGEEE